MKAVLTYTVDLYNVQFSSSNDINIIIKRVEKSLNAALGHTSGLPEKGKGVVVFKEWAELESRTPSPPDKE